MGDDCRHISRIVVHVMAVADLCRAAMPAPVMCDHAVTPFDKVQHLRVPVVRAQWPAVMENDRLPGTPVLVEDLDAVFCGDSAHGVSPFFRRDMTLSAHPVESEVRLRAMPSCSDSRQLRRSSKAHLPCNGS